MRVRTTAREERKGARSDIPFDQNDLIWGHPVQILPFVIGIIFDHERFSFAVGIDKSRREIILLIYTPIIAQAQRPVDSRVGDGPPQVNDLETIFKQLRDVRRRKMSANTLDRRVFGLIDVNLGQRLTLIGTNTQLAWATATNGWGNL